MQGMVPLCGFGGVPYSAVRKAAPRNLLDNSDFRNPVAQAGIGGNHGTIAYAADRWILDSGTVSYEAGVGLTLNGTIRQKLEFPPTGETSAFVGMASGTASISYADGAVTITSSGGVIKWAALYGGVYTETTKPEYQPKGYGAELAECQRYYIRYSAGENSAAAFSVAIAWNDTTARSTFALPIQMRITPTVNTNIMRFLQIVPTKVTGASTAFTTCAITSATILKTNLNNLYVVFSLSDNTIIGATGFISAHDNKNAYIEFSADL